MNEPMTVNIPHQLGADEARQRIANGFAKTVGSVPGGALIKLNERWDGNRMIFEARSLGQTVSGVIDVADSVVTLTVTLPPLLAGLADKFRGRIRDAGQLLLTKR